MLNELKQKDEFVPDIVYIDYLNICSSSRVKNQNANSYTIVKSIAEEIRGLAMEFNIPIWTATQANRCLTLDTNVISKDKGKIKISELSLNDSVLSSDGIYNKVIKIYEKTKQKVYKIRTKSGKTIRCSSKHLFPTENNENMSIDSGLKVGSKLFSRK